MLLLKEEDINKELKNVLLNILSKVEEVKTYTSDKKLQEFDVYKDINELCLEITNSPQGVFVLESFFGKNNIKKLNALSSFLDLSKEEIKILEENYSIKYPQKQNLSSNEKVLLKEVLSFAKERNHKNLNYIKILDNNNLGLLMVNYVIKKEMKELYNHIKIDLYSEVIKPLQSKFLGTNKLTAYNKLFELKDLDLGNLDDKKEYNGFVPVYFKIDKSGNRSSYSCLFNAIDNKKYQVTAFEAINAGFALDEDTIKNYDLFKLSSNAIVLCHKDSLVIDATQEDFHFGERVKQKLEMRTNYDDVRNGELSSNNMNTIKKSIYLKDVPKWAHHSILKYANPKDEYVSFIYLFSEPSLENGGVFVPALIMSPVNDGYFIKNEFEINKENIGFFSKAEGYEKALFLEMLNADYQRKLNYSMACRFDDDLKRMRGY